MRRGRLLPLLAGSFLMAACSQGLDVYSEVVDLRILGMRADPPEILANAPVSLATKFSALVVDGRGGPLTYTWSFCPIETSTGCNDFDAQVNRLAPADQVLLRQMRQVQQTGTVQPTLPADGGAAIYDVPDFDLVAAATAAAGGVDPTPDLFVSYVKQSLLNQGLGVWLSAILEVQNSTQDSVVAQKRLVLGVQDFSALAPQLADRFGFTVCPAPPAAPTPNCLDLPPLPANQNPTFGPLQQGADPDHQTTFAPAASPLTVNLGQRIRLLPTFGAGANEPYRNLRFDFQTHVIETESLVEDPSVSWFTTAGKFESDLTWPKFTHDLSNVLVVPKALPANIHGVITVWLVGRDQRGGEVFLRLPIKVN